MTDYYIITGQVCDYFCPQNQNKNTWKWKNKLKREREKKI